MRQLKALRELQEQLGAEVFLVGGTVRDLVRSQEPNDIDVLVRNVEPAAFEEFLRQKGDLRLVGKSFGVYLFRPKRHKCEIEIAFPRTEVSTGEGHKDFAVHTDPSLSIREDSNRRDFTINALYLDIRHLHEDGTFDKRAVVDFHNGFDHLRKRLVVAVGNPEDRIKEDPLRMLRAMVLVARTGFRLEGNTFGAIKRHSPMLRAVAFERVRDEFIKIMESEKPSRAFKAMQRTGLLREVLPELDECVGCGQNPKYHSYPVFEHLIYATDAACSISPRLDIRLATLCHDLGKAPTRQVRPGGAGPDDVSFHNHEIVSTKLTYAMMKRLRFPRELTEEVVALVRHHQYKYDRTWTDKAMRRFIRNVGISKADLEDLNAHPQFLVRQADRMGNELKAHLPVTQKQNDFQARIREVYEKSSAHSLHDLAINGEDLKAALKLEPGPVIGKAIRYLFDRVEENPDVNTRERLLQLAADFIQQGARSEEELDGNSAIDGGGEVQSEVAAGQGEGQ